jgi:hypothetical protein
MHKSLIVLVMFGTMNVPAVAQTAPAANQAQPAKPQTIKKRVCEIVDEDSYSRLGNRKICKTIEVPVEQQAGSANGQQAPAPANPSSNAGGNTL